MLTHRNERIFEYSFVSKRFVRYVSNIRFSPSINHNSNFSLSNTRKIMFST